MTVDLAAPPFTPQQLAAFAPRRLCRRAGSLRRGRVAIELIATCDELHAQGEIPGCFQAMSPAETSDPLLLYPRMMQPHRVNRTALRYLLSPRWEPHLRALFGRGTHRRAEHVLLEARQGHGARRSIRTTSI